MIKRLVYNKKIFKILDGFTIKQSNAEVTFNDITIDFTGYSLLDIPFKYQELKIIQAETEEEILSGNGEVVFTGFLDDIDLSEMKIRKEEQRELTLTVLSPLAMATKRYVSLIGTYSKEEAIRRVLQPLLDDGFKIVEFTVPTGQITTNFVIENVENCMNDMCFKTGVFWFIDENKNIYINSIDYLFGLGAKMTIAPEVVTKGLSKIQPKIENIDYANVINFKNVRIYYSAMSICDELNNLIEEYDYPLLNLPKKLKKGDTVQFNNPVVVSEDILRKLREEGEIDNASVASLSIVIGGEEFYIRIETNEKSEDYDKYVTSNNFSFSDEGGEEKVLVLQRDSFFSNLITGFKWNGADNSVVSHIYTGTALRYTTMRFMYSAEINNLKGVISDTGIVEKCIDYQEKWTTTTQLIDYARSLMSSNTKTINQVDLTFDETPNLKIGDIVEIHEPDFYIDGKFAVKEISYKYINDENEEWNIKLKNSDLNSTYIDLFRPAQKQENESKTDTVVLSEYVEESVYEKHEIGEKETLTGDVIVVKDNDGLITIEKINGNHKQETTSGKNFLNTDKIKNETKNGVTLTYNEKSKIITLNGTCTTDNTIFSLPSFLFDGTYTLSYEYVSGSFIYNKKNPYIQMLNTTSWKGPNLFFKKSSSNSITSTYSNLKTNGNSIRCDSGTTFYNYAFRIQLELGSTATEYEPYTGGIPSPNPDFPQKIETVGDNINILACIPTLKASVGGLKNTLNDDGSITTAGKPSYNYVAITDLVDITDKLINGEVYTIKQEKSSPIYAQIYAKKADGATTFINTYNTTNKINFTADKTTYKKYLVAILTTSLSAWGDETKTITNKYMLYKGSDEVPFSRYNEGSVELKKQNKNFFNKNVEIKNAYPNITINSTITYVSSNATKTYVKCCYLTKGIYCISYKNGEIVATSTRMGAIVDEKNNVLQSVITWQNQKNEIIVNIQYNGWLIFATDLNAYDIQIEEGSTATSYVEHQEESYIMPIQQEMLEDDYIDDVEHHEWGKYIFTGEETILVGKVEDITFFNISVGDLSDFNYIDDKTLNYMCTHFKAIKVVDRYQNNTFFINVGKKAIFCSKEITTIDDFKACLKERYDSGNPVIIYYQLKTPIELELTDEQKAISKYLQPYDGETTILTIDKLATITISYTKKGENNEN